MSSTVEQATWAPRRWWWMVALVFAGQVGLIFWLGERGPIRARLPAPVPVLRLADGASNEWLSLNNPTLFVLPQRRGFSGQAWLRTTPLPIQPPDWHEEPRFLPLPIAQLGAVDSQFTLTNRFSAVCPPPILEPEVARFDPAPLPLSPAQSNLGIEDQLAGRRLLKSLELPSWSNADLLTNSIVQVLVNAEGRPVSATLLQGSGLTKADDFALAQARAARFEAVGGEDWQPPPGANPLDHLTVGKLIFEWHTDPPTNAPVTPR